MKIVVIEDQAMVRGLVVRACHEAYPCEIIGEASDCRSGVDLCRQLVPDLVLLDLDLPDGDGLDFTGEIRRAAPSARIMVLSSHTDSYSLHRIYRAGVHGFVDKNEQTPEVLCAAMRQIMAGGAFFSEVVERNNAQLRADPKAFTKVLTEREQDLLRHFGQGLTNEQIAARVGLNAFTVRNHRRNIMGKLGIHSTPELIHYAIEKGFTRIRVGS